MDELRDEVITAEQIEAEERELAHTTRIPFKKHKGCLVPDPPSRYLKGLQKWLRERDIFPDVLWAVEFVLRERSGSGGDRG